MSMSDLSLEFRYMLQSPVETCGRRSGGACNAISIANRFPHMQGTENQYGIVLRCGFCHQHSSADRKHGEPTPQINEALIKLYFPQLDSSTSQFTESYSEYCSTNNLSEQLITIMRFSFAILLLPVLAPAIPTPGACDTKCEKSCEQKCQVIYQHCAGTRPGDPGWQVTSLLYLDLHPRLTPAPVRCADCLCL